MAINWIDIYKKHKGKWVALKDDEKSIIASGKTARDVQRKAIDEGYSSPILTRIPQKITSIIGFDR